MNKQELIDDFEQSLQKAEDILNQEQPRISESAVDRIFEKKFFNKQFDYKIKEF